MAESPLLLVDYLLWQTQARPSNSQVGVSALGGNKEAAGDGI